MSRFTIRDMKIPGLHLIERQPLGDKRGSLTRLFCSEELSLVGWTRPIKQINQTVTALAGTVRGLHFQHRPSAEMKLVMCLKGKIFDVALDLRRGSSAFLEHGHAVLSADNGCAFLIPEGCAHGFQALTDDVELLYFHTATYDPSAENGVSPVDNRLAIEWPLEISVMSDRDDAHPRLTSDFSGFDF